MRRTRAIPLIVALAVSGLIASACAGSAAPPTGAPAASAASQSTATGSVAVELIEGKVTADPTTASAGPVTFAIKNIGMNVHEFVVIKTDMKASDLPVKDGVVDEAALTVVGQVENIALRATPTLDVELAPGHYALICNIKDHYGAGMHADFEAS
ncbi:MAG TPA: hypothetical protein VFM38_09645 [Candidatus Limnocylindrales bacterium]|nr:hypothetical protein [Candidatus Limnocylindrales bacterium]